MSSDRPGDRAHDGAEETNDRGGHRRGRRVCQLGPVRLWRPAGDDDRRLRRLGGQQHLRRRVRSDRRPKRSRTATPRLAVVERRTRRLGRRKPHLGLLPSGDQRVAALPVRGGRLLLASASQHLRRRGVRTVDGRACRGSGGTRRRRGRGLHLPGGVDDRPAGLLSRKRHPRARLRRLGRLPVRRPGHVHHDRRGARKDRTRSAGGARPVARRDGGHLGHRQHLRLPDHRPRQRPRGHGARMGAGHVPHRRRCAQLQAPDGDRGQTAEGTVPRRDVAALSTGPVRLRVLHDRPMAAHRHRPRAQSPA